ncbi:hypothetical protein [Tenacibaculum sp. nBUS_03]|uniref:hypothetical protein n=1 Tax=Tenacibaculum sp. nBUS_03 TaxID=3395320 RepID=UPI003EB7B6D5
MLYQTLFNINLLHAYFLDIGEKKYHSIHSDPNKKLNTKEKEDIEKKYDSNTCIEIIPNRITLETIKDYRLMVRKHSKGMRILTTSIKEVAMEGANEIERYSPLINLPDDLTLTFFVKVTDRYFDNYTEIIDKTKKQFYHLSNISSSAINIFEANTAIKKWNSFLISEEESRRLVYEMEKENEFISNTPKKVTIADFDATKINTIETKIQNNTSLNTQEQEVLDSLNSSVQKYKNKGIIGVLKLRISGDNTTRLTENVLVKNSETNNFDVHKKCVLKQTPNFQIYIENRKTFWRYNQLSDNLKMITNTKHPLTKNGRVEIGKTDVTPHYQGTIFFPNPAIDSVTLDKSSQDYYSEIFI